MLQQSADTHNTTDHSCSLLNTTKLHDMSRARHCVTKCSSTPSDVQGEHRRTRRAWTAVVFTLVLYRLP